MHSMQGLSIDSGIIVDLLNYTSRMCLSGTGCLHVHVCHTQLQKEMENYVREKKTNLPTDQCRLCDPDSLS